MALDFSGVAYYTYKQGFVQANPTTAFFYNDAGAVTLARAAYINMCGFDIDPLLQKIYWVERGFPWIWRANLDFTGVEVLRLYFFLRFHLQFKL
jgi:hypothetical protein